MNLQITVTVEGNAMNTVQSTAVRSSGLPIAGTRSRTADISAGEMRSVYMVLKITFSLIPIVAGLDKFTNLLTNWELYTSPILAHALPFSPHTFMEVVGVIEIIAGLIVFSRPRLGALIVTAWLVCIALNLLASGRYFDVAVRDLVMAVAAFTLARLTPIIESNKVSK